MIMFGVDVSLVEVIAAFSIITTIILIEVIIIMIVLMYQLRNTRKINEELMKLIK